MKRFLTVTLLTIFLSALSSSSVLTAGRGDERQALLTEILTDMTLSEALRLYPEIEHFFPIRTLSEHEAAEKIAAGARLISSRGDEILAVPFLAQFNWQGGA